MQDMWQELGASVPSRRVPFLLNSPSVFIASGTLQTVLLICMEGFDILPFTVPSK